MTIPVQEKKPRLLEFHVNIQPIGSYKPRVRTWLEGGVLKEDENEHKCNRSPLSVRQCVIAGRWWQLQCCGVMSPSSQQDWVCFYQVGSGACHLLLSHSDACLLAEERATDACCVLGNEACYMLCHRCFWETAWKIQAAYQTKRAG